MAISASDPACDEPEYVELPRHLFVFLDGTKKGWPKVVDRKWSYRLALGCYPCMSSKKRSVRRIGFGSVRSENLLGSDINGFGDFDHIRGVHVRRIGRISDSTPGYVSLGAKSFSDPTEHPDFKGMQVMDYYKSAGKRYYHPDPNYPIRSITGGDTYFSTTLQIPRKVGAPDSLNAYLISLNRVYKYEEHGVREFEQFHFSVAVYMCQYLIDCDLDLLRERFETS